VTRRGVVEQPLLSNGSSTAKQEYYGFLFVVGSSKKVAGWKCQICTLVGICLLMQWIYIFCAILLGRTTFHIQIVECWNKEKEAAFLAFHVTWGTHPRGIVAFSLIWLNTQLVLEHRQSWFLNSSINLLNVFVSVCVWYGFVR